MILGIILIILVWVFDIPLWVSVAATVAGYFGIMFSCLRFYTKFASVRNPDRKKS